MGWTNTAIATSWVVKLQRTSLNIKVVYTCIIINLMCVFCLNKLELNRNNNSQGEWTCYRLSFVLRRVHFYRSLIPEIFCIPVFSLTQYVYQGILKYYAFAKGQSYTNISVQNELRKYILIACYWNNNTNTPTVPKIDHLKNEW